MTTRRIAGSPLTERQERIISRSRPTHPRVSPKISCTFCRHAAGRVEVGNGGVGGAGAGSGRISAGNAVLIGNGGNGGNAGIGRGGPGNAGTGGTRGLLLGQNGMNGLT
jgi:hypothetical protein